MFKTKHGMLPSSVTELFNNNHTNYNLRNADFRQECFTTPQNCDGKHSLSHFGPLLLSKINREFRSAPTLSNFKKGIRKTDIASLIDDSCNDCVLCKTQHQFASPFYSLSQSDSIYDSEIFLGSYLFRNQNLAFKLVRHLCA